DRLARERRLIRGDGELEMVPGIALVARDDSDARARMTLEPLAAGLLVVARVRERHPEAPAARRLKRAGTDVRRVGIGRALELGHRLDDEILTVGDRGEARGRDRQTRSLHLGAVRLDKRVLGGVVLAQGFDRGAPVLMAKLHRSSVQRGLGLAVELVTPLAKRRRIVIEQLLLFQPLVDGVAQERAGGATGERVGAEPRLPPPPREWPNGALASGVRDGQGAVETVRGKRLVLGEGLEAREPVIVEAVTRRKSVGTEITEPV